MKIIKHTDPNFRSALEAVVNRANLDLVTHDDVVREILGRVKHEGDVALLEYTSRFDHHELTLENLKVTRE